MKLKTEDGRIVDTAKALEYWKEATHWDGSNHISRNTRSQWHHEMLYKSAKGNYYIVSTSAIQGEIPSAEFVDEKTAARWLTLNDEELPDDLKAAADQATE